MVGYAVSYMSYAVLVAAIALYALTRYSMLEHEEYRQILSAMGEIVGEKTVVVTGANAGLGFETAKFLAIHGHKVIMGCRNATRCAAAKQDIMRHKGITRADGTSDESHFVEPDTSLPLDLASFASIRAFASAFALKYPRGFDVLVNNAGVMALIINGDNGTMPRTADGLEAQMGINHFGHFLLTALLFPLLRRGGRVVNHSSNAHLASPAAFLDADWKFEHTPYTFVTTWQAYAYSKAANLQFTYEINDRLAAAGNPLAIMAVAVHPGFTVTDLHGKAVAGSLLHRLDFLLDYVGMRARDGAQTQILAAIGPAAPDCTGPNPNPDPEPDASPSRTATHMSVSPSNNTFLQPKYVFFGPPRVGRTGKYLPSHQRRLWAESEALTGQKFNIGPTQPEV